MLGRNRLLRNRDVPLNRPAQYSLQVHRCVFLRSGGHRSRVATRHSCLRRLLARRNSRGCADCSSVRRGSGAHPPTQAQQELTAPRYSAMSPSAADARPNFAPINRAPALQRFRSERSTLHQGARNPRAGQGGDPSAGPLSVIFWPDPAPHACRRNNAIAPDVSGGIWRVHWSSPMSHGTARAGFILLLILRCDGLGRSARGWRRSGSWRSGSWGRTGRRGHGGRRWRPSRWWLVRRLGAVGGGAPAGAVGGGAPAASSDANPGNGTTNGRPSGNNTVGGVVGGYTGVGNPPPMTQDGRRRPRRWARLGKLQPLLQRKGQPSSQRAQLLA